MRGYILWGISNCDMPHFNNIFYTLKNTYDMERKYKIVKIGYFS